MRRRYKITLLREALVLKGLLGFSSDSVSDKDKGVAGLKASPFTTAAATQAPSPPLEPPLFNHGGGSDGSVEEEKRGRTGTWIADLFLLRPHCNGILRSASKSNITPRISRRSSTTSLSSWVNPVDRTQPPTMLSPLLCSISVFFGVKILVPSTVFVFGSSEWKFALGF